MLREAVLLLVPIRAQYLAQYLFRTNTPEIRNFVDNFYIITGAEGKALDAKRECDQLDSISREVRPTTLQQPI